jgi:hypothetical protein
MERITKWIRRGAQWRFEGHHAHRLRIQKFLQLQAEGIRPRLRPKGEILRSLTCVRDDKSSN